MVQDVISDHHCSRPRQCGRSGKDEWSAFEHLLGEAVMHVDRTYKGEFVSVGCSARLVDGMNDLVSHIHRNDEIGNRCLIGGECLLEREKYV